ncbi:MAG: DUF4234 domain-containing protein [Candidatus Poribacteria bacterium]|nr:DUF4234 domain-containing protein [Candidatus Poribacteria bacterium]
MLNQYPYPEFEGRRSIVTGILATVLTCGIYGIYWQFKQMTTLNAWLGRNEYSFWLWFFLCILTCGIFGIYYEYKMACGINEIQTDKGMYVDQNLPILCVVLALFGVGIASLAIQQYQINKLYGDSSDG